MPNWMQTIIVGHVGRDVTLRYTQDGTPVCDFSVAVTTKSGKGENRVEKTTWFKVTCWRQLAETAKEYVRKGGAIMVVGTINVSAYTDKSGQPAASLELTASSFQLLGRRGDEDAPAPGDKDMGNIPF